MSRMTASTPTAISPSLSSHDELTGGLLGFDSRPRLGLLGSGVASSALGFACRKATTRPSSSLSNQVPCVLQLSRKTFEAPPASKRASLVRQAAQNAGL